MTILFKYINFKYLILHSMKYYGELNFNYKDII